MKNPQTSTFTDEREGAGEGGKERERETGRKRSGSWKVKRNLCR